MMRSYAARLAKLEAALKPEADIVIRVVYVDEDGNWRPEDAPAADTSRRVDYRRGLAAIAPPIARVAPGLLAKLQPGYATDSPPADEPAPPPAAAHDAQPSGDETPWNFAAARAAYREPPAGPNLRRMRAAARRGRQ